MVAYIAACDGNEEAERESVSGGGVGGCGRVGDAAQGNGEGLPSDLGTDPPQDLSVLLHCYLDGSFLMSVSISR